VTNKIKSFFNAKRILTFFLFTHFLLISLALLFGRYAENNVIVKISSIYQTRLFTQNWKLFSSSPYALTFWYKVNGQWLDMSRDMSWLDEKKRVWIYNALHYFLGNSLSDEHAFIEQISSLTGKTVTAFLIQNSDSRLSFRYVYFHREQNLYIWKKFILK
jgi:hypothetical protein